MHWEEVSNLQESRFWYSVKVKLVFEMQDHFELYIENILEFIKFDAKLKLVQHNFLYAYCKFYFELNIDIKYYIITLSFEVLWVPSMLLSSLIKLDLLRIIEEYQWFSSLSSVQFFSLPLLQNFFCISKTFVILKRTKKWIYWIWCPYNLGLTLCKRRTPLVIFLP